MDYVNTKTSFFTSPLSSISLWDNLINGWCLGHLHSLHLDQHSDGTPSLRSPGAHGPTRKSSSCRVSTPAKDPRLNQRYSGEGFFWLLVTFSCAFVYWLSQKLDVCMYHMSSHVYTHVNLHNTWWVSLLKDYYHSNVSDTPRLLKRWNLQCHLLMSLFIKSLVDLFLD